MAAYLDCRRSKRNTQGARLFETEQEPELWTLHQALTDGSYRPGRST